MGTEKSVSMSWQQSEGTKWQPAPLAGQDFLPQSQQPVAATNGGQQWQQTVAPLAKTAPQPVQPPDQNNELCDSGCWDIFVRLPCYYKCFVILGIIVALLILLIIILIIIGVASASDNNSSY